MAAERFLKIWKLLLELIRKKAESKSARVIKKEALSEEPTSRAVTSPPRQASAAKSAKASVIVPVAAVVSSSTTIASPVQHIHIHISHSTALTLLIFNGG